MQTKNEIIKAKLDELSADIKSKVGKTARENLESACNRLIYEEIWRIEKDHTDWLNREVLEMQPQEIQDLWRRYIGTIAAVHAFTSAKQGYKSNSSKDISTLDFDHFVTGMQYGSDANNAMRPLYEKVRGYKARQAKHDAAKAELEALKKAAKAAIWRSHRQSGHVVSAGRDMVQAFTEVVKQAIGAPALDAPVIVPEVVMAE